jgi:hypothetical protein
MSATNVLEAGILSLIFENANYAGLGDGTGLRGSTVANSFYISLLTGDPTDVPASGQNTNETGYNNYVRQAVARDTASWTVTAPSFTQAANDNAINFPTCGATPGTVGWFGIGSASSGIGVLYFKGQLSQALAISSGITPSFAANALTIQLD